MKAPHTDEVAEYKMMAKDATQHHLFHICPQPRQFLNSELFRKEKALKFLWISIQVRNGVNLSFYSPDPLQQRSCHPSVWLTGLFHVGCLTGLRDTYISDIIFPLMMIASCMLKVKQELTKFQSLTKMINSEPAWGRDLPGRAEKPVAEGKLAGCGALRKHKQETQQLAQGLTDGLEMAPPKWAPCLINPWQRQKLMFVTFYFHIWAIPVLKIQSPLRQLWKIPYTKKSTKLTS